MNQSLVIGGLIGVFVMVCVLFEAFLILRFRIARFLPALLQAAIANVASVAVLYFMWPVVARMDIDEDKVFPLLPILLITTVVVEAVLLKALNRGQLWQRVFSTSLVMNVASFAVLYAILLLFL